MKLMIDLFSGLGGASQAFMNSPEWAVLRYDNNPALSNVAATTICDLKEYQIICRHDIDLIWASPPCLTFSTAYNAPKSIAQIALFPFVALNKRQDRAVMVSVPNVRSAKSQTATLPERAGVTFVSAAPAAE